jgi:hypothetical protein
MGYKIIIELNDDGQVKTSFFNQDNINPLSGALLISELEAIKLQILIAISKFKSYSKGDGTT